LAIGASIGGPTTLTTLLTQLPQNLPLAIIIVQHVDAQFASSLTDWLSQKTGRLIRPAQEGDVIKEGDILMASKQQHLILNHHLNLGYTEHPIGAAYKPSIDVFFNSLARWWPVKSMALLLTGMGNDGAESLKKLKEADWYTMIEHPDDCVIHSMPTAALDLEAAVDVLKCDEIPNAIMHFCQKHALRSNE
jgi:two-component system response regulator WspF